MPPPDSVQAARRQPGRSLPVLLFGREAVWSTPLPAGAGPLLLFTACDPAHLDHAIALVRSADVFSPGSTFVLHLLNPGREDLERVRVLNADLRATTLALSVETVHLDGLDPAVQRAYAADARFFRLDEISHELHCPLLSLDADSLIVAPIGIGNLPPDDIGVVAGTHLVRPTEAAAAWLAAAARERAARLAAGAAARPGSPPPEIDRRTSVLDARLADPAFRADGLIWSGRGRSKHLDLRFFMLQRLLSDDARDRSLALRMAAELDAAVVRDEPGLAARLQAVRARLPAWVAVFVPRLDQPWGAASAARVPPSIAAEMLTLRLHWKEFSSRLANEIERRGVRVELFEWPLREIVPENVDAVGASLALIPHRCKLDYATASTPVTFYMQEYYRWVFVVDHEGWSAASSRYPVDPAQFAQAPVGAFDEYRGRLGQGRLASKFGQPPRATRRQLEEAGEIPRGEYIFLPLQIPHDQAIRYFSAVGVPELVAALVRWSRERAVALVLKPHPANPKSMAEFAALPRGELLYWSTANVDDLIAHSTAVYTINSGVGFEALLQSKPVVTFGRAEYDCVTVNARPETLDAAWREVQASRPDDLEARYRGFVDWFLGAYAVDMSLETAATARLGALADGLASRARSTSPPAALCPS